MKTESNRIIAEFMGKTIYPTKIPANNKLGFKWSYPWKGEPKDFHDFELKYNSDWNWLMPVVEKIGNMKADVIIKILLHSRDGVQTINKGCQIDSHNWEGINIMGKDYSLLEATYKAVIEFINWYNTQQDEKPK